MKARRQREFALVVGIPVGLIALVGLAIVFYKIYKEPRKPDASDPDQARIA